ncbi:hypothetical protein [Streptomyces mirabilis]|uniref:hypothetical protein n=1 Tax=Streptomyces mirabilis TaxID=68239 RepID=UPI0036D7EDB4
MNEQRAIELIKGISYRPGWKITAEPMVPGLPFVVVQAYIDTVNTNREQAIKGYPQKIVLGPDTVIDASLYATPEDLYRRILDWIIGLEVHEAREFFRVGTDMQAPFHPHREECERAWERTAREVSVSP